MSCADSRDQYTYGCECRNDAILEFSNMFQKKLDNNTPSRLVRGLGAWPEPGRVRLGIRPSLAACNQTDRWRCATQMASVRPPTRTAAGRIWPREHIAFSSPLCVALVVAWPYRQHVRPLYRFVFVCGKNTHPAVHSVCADQIFARMDVEDI